MSAAHRSLAWAVRAMNGKLLGKAVGAPPEGGFVGGVHDSREVKPGQMFFALRGERVDGFEHCEAAARAGAAAVVVAAAQGRPVGCERTPVIAVEDPRAALGDIARAARAEFRGRVVGVTGSNGKTTTKELIAAALGASGEVMRTAGNFNTDVGLPLTVLGASGQEAYWVLEMAMRARGEIAYLAGIARPHVAVVTNVAAAHLGRLGSLDEVARAKGEIFGGLVPEGVAVLPDDEPRLDREAAGLSPGSKRRFGFGTGSEVSSERDVRLLEVVPGTSGAVVRLSVGDVPVVERLPLAGEHNARNAAAALAVVASLGLPVLPAAAALESTALPPHRSRLLALAGRTVLDDSYNANPASMSAALATAATSVGDGGHAFAILGDMLELGSDSEALHAGVGRELARRGMGGLAAVGDLAAHIARGARDAGLGEDRVMVTADPVEAANAVARWSAPGDWIVVKASRGMRLERAVAALESALGGG